MNERERYLVGTTDGQTYTMVGKTFGQILEDLGEKKVWFMIRLDFEEAKV